MIDRQPTLPGRIKITPEDGSPAYYATMEMADEPAELGTPLNKETLLSDETCDNLGIPRTSVPDDAFNHLSGAETYKKVYSHKFSKNNIVIPLDFARKDAVYRLWVYNPDISRYFSSQLRVVDPTKLNVSLMPNRSFEAPGYKPNGEFDRFDQNYYQCDLSGGPCYGYLQFRILNTNRLNDDCVVFEYTGTDGQKDVGVTKCLIFFCLSGMGADGYKKCAIQLNSSINNTIEIYENSFPKQNGGSK